MRPSVVLLGFVLGTAVSVMFSLVGVAVIFLVLGPKYPRIEAEADSLLVSLAFFGALTVFAALSFYGVLKQRRWRAAAIAPLIVNLVRTGWCYWAEWRGTPGGPCPRRSCVAGSTGRLVISFADALPRSASVERARVVRIEFDPVRSRPGARRHGRRAPGQDIARRGRRARRTHRALASGAHQSAQKLQHRV